MPAECYKSSPFGAHWIEIFHSLPSWKRCFIVFRRDGGDWIPNAKYELRDARSVRPGFRVFRIHAKKLEFYLTNGSSRNWENNGGKNYTIDEAGRFIVSYCSIRRVGDADVDSCIRTIRSHDRYIEIFYRASQEWQQCFLLYSRDGGVWNKAPGTKMIQHRSTDPFWFFIRLEGHSLDFALNDGAAQWDSNFEANYHVAIPGKYILNEGKCVYVGPTELDRIAYRH